MYLQKPGQKPGTATNQKPDQVSNEMKKKKHESSIGDLKTPKGVLR